MKSQPKLPKEFYERDVHIVARELLGKRIVRNIDGILLSGRIAEVEAYDGTCDEASHSFRGKTPRNEVMFGGGGFLYVYFTYGMHFCSNVTTGKEGDGKAVLIRGIEPVTGISIMQVNRFGKRTGTDMKLEELTNGPAKICQAFGIGRSENGTALTGDQIYITDEEPLPQEMIVQTTRIGIKKSVDLPWRYYIKENRFVSKR